MVVFRRIREWAVATAAPRLASRRQFEPASHGSAPLRAPRPTAALQMLNPPTGATYLIDPTLRPEFQTLPLRVVAPAPTQIEWTVNGTPIGARSSEAVLDWRLRPGLHLIAARDTHGNVVESRVPCDSPMLLLCRRDHPHVVPLLSCPLTLAARGDRLIAFDSGRARRVLASLSRDDRGAMRSADPAGAAARCATISPATSGALYRLAVDRAAHIHSGSGALVGDRRAPASYRTRARSPPLVGRAVGRQWRHPVAIVVKFHRIIGRSGSLAVRRWPRPQTLAARTEGVYAL